MNPYPGQLLWCTYPFLPTEQRPSRRYEPVGAWQYPHSNFCVGGLTRLQLFVYLQARRFARHPDCSHRCISSTQGDRGFYVPAYLGLLPRRAGDMLTVRFGQLTVKGLSPFKIHSLAGCSHTPSRPRGIVVLPLSCNSINLAICWTGNSFSPQRFILAILAGNTFQTTRARSIIRDGSQSTILHGFINGGLIATVYLRVGE